METGIEPVCTALQAVASPLGHSTVGVDAIAPRADDGIRTRDPHLGKVMRYQLRYIRAPRARSSPGAKHDDSPRERAHTNFLVRAVSRLSRRTWHPDAAGIVGVWHVLIFDVVRHLGAGPVAQWESVRFTRGRSLVRSQPGPPGQGHLSISVRTTCAGYASEHHLASMSAAPVWI